MQQRAICALLMATTIALQKVVVTRGFPKVPICGAPKVVGQEEVLLTKWIDAETFEDSGASNVDLDPEEGALLTITTGGIRRQRQRRRRRRRRQQGVDLASLGLCQGSEGDDDEEDDDIDFHPLLDDNFSGEDGEDDDGCDWEDDDHEVDEQNLGSDSQQVVVRIVDALEGVLSEKVPFSFDNDSKDVFMWSRGQRGQCAHPTRVTVEGVEGRGVVEIRSVKLRREGWNEAALTFADAVDVTQKSEWCGSVNWISQEADPQCDYRKNTPKWKVWLNPQDKLLVTARLFCRQDSEERFATKVQLKLYRAPETENEEALVLNSRIVGLKTKRESFVNAGAASWFHLELVRTERHLYEYAIAFEVERNCADERKGRFVLPKDEETCGWLAQQSPSKIESLCAPSSKSNAKSQCRQTCGTCSDCIESATTQVILRPRNCLFLRKKRAKLQAKGKWERYCQDSIAGTVCADACGKCPPTSGP